MGFLRRVEIAAANDIIVTLDDIYSEDPQFKELVDLSVDLLAKFADKFSLNEKAVVDLFVKQVRKEI